MKTLQAMTTTIAVAIGTFGLISLSTSASAVTTAVAKKGIANELAGKQLARRYTYCYITHRGRTVCKRYGRYRHPGYWGGYYWAPRSYWYRHYRRCYSNGYAGVYSRSYHIAKRSAISRCKAHYISRHWWKCRNRVSCRIIYR